MSIADWNQKHIQVLSGSNGLGIVHRWNKSEKKKNVGYWRDTTLQKKEIIQVEFSAAKEIGNCKEPQKLANLIKIFFYNC